MIQLKIENPQSTKTFPLTFANIAGNLIKRKTRKNPHKMNDPGNIRTDETYKGIFVEAVEKYPGMIFFLEGEKIKFCNRFVLEQLGVSQQECEGKTLGEIFKCANAIRKGKGCGGNERCSECGRKQLFLLGVKGAVNKMDWRLSVFRDGREEPLILRIWAVTSISGGEDMVICYVQDASHEKIREILENTFFHDILNEASVLKGYTDNIRDGLLACDAASIGKVFDFANSIIETIQTQRDLLIAERGLYRSQDREVGPREFFSEIMEVMSSGRVGAKRNIEFCSEAGDDAVIMADKAILKRVVINLIKNALEASDAKSAVKVGFRVEQGRNIIFVNNPGVIPPATAKQLFLKGFSTKGKGRGLGTYSARFFTERYLKGEIDFRSEEAEGTTFFVKLPGKGK